MKHSNNKKINFENIIITPLEKWVDTDIELEQKTVEKLQLLAEKSNQSVDNVLTHFLEDFFSEHLELSKLNAESLQQAAEKSPMILILQNGKPVARVKMLEWGDENEAFPSKKLHQRKKIAASKLNRSQIATSLFVKQRQYSFIFFNQFFFTPLGICWAGAGKTVDSQVVASFVVGCAIFLPQGEGGFAGAYDVMYF